MANTTVRQEVRYTSTSPTRCPRTQEERRGDVQIMTTASNCCSLQYQRRRLLNVRVEQRSCQYKHWKNIERKERTDKVSTIVQWPAQVSIQKRHLPSIPLPLLCPLQQTVRLSTCRQRQFQSPSSSDTQTRTWEGRRGAKINVDHQRSTANCC